MKKIALLVGLVFIAATMFAQYGAAPLTKGQKQLNFGLGSSNHGIPAYIGMDFAVHNDITVGPVVKVRIDDDISFGLLGRGDYHFNRIIGIPSNFDFYAGASVGFFSGNEDAGGIDIGIQVGGRWYWSEKWGLNLEFGGGTGYGTSIGLSMKM